MLHSFDVVVNHMLIETEQRQEIGEELMPASDVAGERFPGGSQDEAPVLLVFKETIGVEPLDHVGDAGLGNLQAGGDIDDAGVTLRVNQLEDPFEVILDCGGIASGFLRGGHSSGKVNGVYGQVKIKLFGH